jgi:hypothetical protein
MHSLISKIGKDAADVLLDQLASSSANTKNCRTTRTLTETMSDELAKAMSDFQSC